MKCIYCKKETDTICSCGYCMECQEKYSHQMLDQLVKEQEEKQ